jgi:chromosome segregation ATPase
MAEDTREDLERESRSLTKFHDKLLAEAKTFESQMQTLENDSLKELAKRDDAVAKNIMTVAAKALPFDDMAAELAKLKKDKVKFDKKKKAFQKDLSDAEWEMSNRPRLLDDLEKQFTLCMTAAKSLQDKATELTGVFPQVAGEVDKLNARIKKFNDSLSAKEEKIKSIVIESPDLKAYPPKLTEIMKKLDADESEIKENRKELKGSVKQLSETIGKLNELQPAPAKPGKPVKK